MNESASPITVIASSEIDNGDPEAGVELARWAALAEAALRAEGVGAGELNLLFIDETSMAELNVAHMEGTGPTDVLAFPIDGEDAGLQGDLALPVLLGDVVVCPSVARRNATTHGQSFDDEVALLVVHGVLHVLGHDHAESEETALMKSREQCVLAEHHRP